MKRMYAGDDNKMKSPCLEGRKKHQFRHRQTEGELTLRDHADRKCKWCGKTLRQVRDEQSGKVMSEERKIELLAYAKICFDHSTDPFALIHLQKKKVNADECRDLSHEIAVVLLEELHAIADRSSRLIYTDIARALMKAEAEYEETQQ